jgi:hypothetical protein
VVLFWPTLTIIFESQRFIRIAGELPLPITAHLLSTVAGAALSGILATWREKQCQAVSRISSEKSVNSASVR